MNPINTPRRKRSMAVRWITERKTTKRGTVSSTVSGSRLTACGETADGKSFRVIVDADNGYVHVYDRVQRTGTLKLS